MSAHLLLRAFVNERLTAAAEEIFRVFDRTIARYEEEASSSRQEIERLSGLLLQSVSSSTADLQKSSTFQEKSPSEQQELSLSVGLGDSEPQDIKEEDHELWLRQQQREEEEQRHSPQSFVCKGQSHPEQQHCEHELSLSVGQVDAEPRHIKEEEHDVWDSEQQEEDEEQEYTKMPLQLCAENSDSEQWSLELQESRPAQLGLPLASASQSVICHDERSQGGRENKRPAASFTNQTQTEQSQNIFIISSGLSHLNAVASEHRCHLCNKSFSSSKFLINHALRVHSKDEDVLCAVCGLTFESTQSLGAHLKTHKGSNYCPVCGRHCHSVSALTEHMAGHNGVKLHCCHVCGRECSRKGDLKIHMRIHTGEKPFCCSLCHKTFTHSGHLRKHMRIHTGERPHLCQVCGRGFMQSVHLKYHMRIHTQKY